MYINRFIETVDILNLLDVFHRQLFHGCNHEIGAVIAFRSMSLSIDSVSRISRMSRDEGIDLSLWSPCLPRSTHLRPDFTVHQTIKKSHEGALKRVVHVYAQVNYAEKYILRVINTWKDANSWSQKSQTISTR